MPNSAMKPKRKQGEVLLFVGEHAPADAALAFLIQSAAPGARSLIVDAPAKSGDPANAIRVGDRGVWRAAYPASGRMRDWVLFLLDCRTQYDRIALATDNCDQKTRAWLLQAADRVVLVADPDEWSAADSLLELRRLRQAGAARCECLWLGAA